MLHRRHQLTDDVVTLIFERVMEQPFEREGRMACVDKCERMRAARRDMIASGESFAAMVRATPSSDVQTNLTFSNELFYQANKLSFSGHVALVDKEVEPRMRRRPRMRSDCDRAEKEKEQDKDDEDEWTHLLRICCERDETGELDEVDG